VAPESGTLPDLAEERLVKITERVVSEAAEQGKVVLVGRAALAVLASHPGTLHLKIVAPLANRIARVVERQGVDMKQAEKLIHDADSNRARYHKQYYQRDWADPTNYDLVINTARIGIEGAVEVIVDRLKRIGDGY
jgi:cytidylate kinase